MVGRLVEHQHVVAGQQHLGQRHPSSLAARQPSHVGVEVHVRTAGAPTTSRVSGSAAQMWSGRPPTMTSRMVVPAEVVGLAQVAHRQSGRMGDAARIGLPGAGQHLQQRRLAVAVAPDDADRIAVVDTQADRVEQRAGAVTDARALDVDQVRHQPPMIGGPCAMMTTAIGGLRPQDGIKGEQAVVDLSAITRPVGRLVATAQNGLEVLRYGGLETGAVPSPFQIIQSVPMYRLRRYFPPDVRPGAKRPGPPGVDGAPHDDVGRHVGCHPRRRRRRHPAQGGHRPVGHRLRLARQGRRRHGPQPRRPRRRAERSHRHRQRGHRPRRASGRLFAGRHVRLPGRGLPPVEGPGQHRRVRRTGRHPGRPADEHACQPGARGRGLHGRSRVQPDRHPGLAGAHRVPDARPDQDRAVAAGLPAPAARPRGAAAARTAAAFPCSRRAGSHGPGRRSPNCSSSSSRTTG